MTKKVLRNNVRPEFSSCHVVCTIDGCELQCHSILCHIMSDESESSEDVFNARFTVPRLSTVGVDVLGVD